jgi:hypothetical protein
VNADDGVGVIDRPGKHARELGAADARLESRKLRFDLGNHLLVALGRAEFEQHACVLDVARQLLDAAYLLFETGALSIDDLRFLLIVPETRSERLLLELGYCRLELRKVKDAPLAP